MRIAAIYIPEDALPHVFSQGHSEITINLGGRNLYKVNDENITEVKPNPYHVDDIFSNKISLLTAIVGGNGGGKTSLLKLLSSNSECLFVFETEDTYLIGKINDWHRVYYTPYLSNFYEMGENGRNLSKLSLLKSDNHSDSNLLSVFLESHHSESMKRWIRFNHFFRNTGQNKVKLPTFSKLILGMGHFDLTVHKPNAFHDTSFQLQPAITHLLNKIQMEQQQEESVALEGYDLDDDNVNVNEIYFPVRFKYDLYELALAKLVSILERVGNRYLQEGIIPDDYNQQMANLDARGSIVWFLQNAGVYRGENRYMFSKHLMLINLIDYIVSLIDSKRVTDNWRKIEISEEEAFSIIELYDQFNKSFINEWLEFDTKPMFTFRPLISVSSGEQSFLDLFSTLYYHAANIEAGIDNNGSLEDIKENILLMLDEGDNAFHPQWKKEYVKYLREIIPLIFPNFNIQVIFTSHDPLTLSDLPKNNVIYLERNNGITTIGNPEYKRTLGANISDLLKDSFFIQDGQIGAFIAGVIDEIITDIKGNNISPKRKIEIERVIKAIDEPVLKFKLAEMLSEISGDKGFEIQMIEDEISRLEEKRRNI